MVPIAETATQNATAANDASVSTRLLVNSIAEIDATARSLRDQAAELEVLVNRFTIDGSVSAAQRPGRSARRLAAVS
jgi:hypothetical protein